MRKNCSQLFFSQTGNRVIKKRKSVAVYQDSSTEIGNIIMKLIWSAWLINGLTLVYLILIEVFKKLRRLYLRKKAKKSKLLATSF